MTLGGLIVFLIIIGLFCFVLRILSGVLQIPAPIVQLLYALIIVVGMLYLLQAFGVLNMGPVLRLN